MAARITRNRIGDLEPAKLVKKGEFIAQVHKKFVAVTNTGSCWHHIGPNNLEESRKSLAFLGP
jgi:hypothetical protein